MIHYVTGDIFKSPAQTIVNPVNCVGVMGAGLALAFRKNYPQMFERYQSICDSGKFRPGVLMYYKTDDYYVINFPTKDHWRDKSELQYIESGLRNFRKHYADRGVTSVAFPPLGCGLGGLRWRQVKPLMEKYLGDLPIDVYIHKPKG